MAEKAFQILAGCQIVECATEVSYPIGMLRWWGGAPICQTCFEMGGYQKYDKAKDEYTPDWHDLEPLTIEQGAA